jgi:hypothetical protein
MRKQIVYVSLAICETSARHDQPFNSPQYKTSQQYAQWEKFRGTSNKGYHYMGSAEFFAEASDAFANAMIELMKK